MEVIASKDNRRLVIYILVLRMSALLQESQASNSSGIVMQTECFERDPHSAELPRRYAGDLLWAALSDGSGCGCQVTEGSSCDPY